MLNRYVSNVLRAFVLMFVVGAFFPSTPFALETSPVGFTAQRIAGTGGQFARARTYLATPFQGRAVETGVIGRIDGATLHVQHSESSAEGEPEKPFQRSTYADTHYLQITKGPRVGYHVGIVAGDAHTLQLSQDLSGLLKPGDAYRVRPYMTLFHVLGRHNESASLHAAPAFDQADQIYIPEPQSGQLAAYYYRQQAEEAPVLAHRDGQPVEKAPILYPGSGFMISRIAEDDARLMHSGDVQNHAAVIPVETGVNFIASTFPVDTTLAELFGPRLGGLSEGDAVHLPREFDIQAPYRVVRSAGALRWLPLGDAPPAVQARIPVGSVVILQRRGGPFNLRLERPFD